jgi:hypothetical protein
MSEIHTYKRYATGFNYDELWTILVDGSEEGGDPKRSDGGV